MPDPRQNDYSELIVYLDQKFLLWTGSLKD